MATFLGLYYAEVRREVKLIAYLDVNSSRPSDNESVGQVLEKMQVASLADLLALCKDFVSPNQ
jgi:hypothetical protein